MWALLPSGCGWSWPLGNPSWLEKGQTVGMFISPFRAATCSFIHLTILHGCWAGSGESAWVTVSLVPFLVVCEQWQCLSIARSRVPHSPLGFPYPACTGPWINASPMLQLERWVFSTAVKLPLGTLHTLSEWLVWVPAIPLFFCLLCFEIYLKGWLPCFRPLPC